MAQKRRWPAFMRAQVFDRDRGVCALCGLDTEALKREVFDLSPDQRAARKQALGWPVHRIDYWDADHVTAVADGGPCALDNLRTLCLPCHKAVSAAWMTANRSGARPATSKRAAVTSLPTVHHLPKKDGAWWVASRAVNEVCANCQEPIHDVPAVMAYRRDLDTTGGYQHRYDGWAALGWVWWYECSACDTYQPWLGVGLDRIRSWKAGPWRPLS